jgi:hypothetical protein
MEAGKSTSDNKTIIITMNTINFILNVNQLKNSCGLEEKKLVVKFVLTELDSDII